MPVAIPESAAEPCDTPEQREEREVHQVYERIAEHFSQTRYKPWPIVHQFLSSIPPGSLGLDSGAGNGKYIPTLRQVSRGSRMIALDRSEGLLGFARTCSGEEQLEECVRGDLCFQGWREGVFDFAISIAAIHHLSTPDRRCLSVQRLIRTLHLRRAGAHSRFLIYVWAYEQGENSKRKMGALGGDDGAANSQDVLVPWVLQPPQQPQQARQKKGKGKQQAPSVGQSDSPEETMPPPVAAPQVFHRYYHLFVKGELEQLITEAAEREGFGVVDQASSDSLQASGRWLRIVQSGYERDNWWLEGEVGLA